MIDDSVFLGSNPIGKFYLPKNDVISSTIASGQVFDDHIVEIIREYSGKVALDVGANVGQMTVLMSSIFDKVYSFEADPYLVKIIKANLELNNITNVEVIKGAVWDIAGIDLPFPEPDGTHQSMGSYGVRPGKTNCRHINSITIDDLNLDDVAFMKFDIQGADLRGLKGAENTLLRSKPDVIFEYESYLVGEFNESMVDYMSFVDRIGYKTKRQVRSDILITWKGE